MPGFVHSVQVQRSTPGPPDDYNQPTDSWATIATVAGLVEPKNVDELNQANQAGVVISDSSIYLPASTDVQEDDRLVYAGDNYRIDGIERRPYGKLRHLKVNATKVAA